MAGRCFLGLLTLSAACHGPDGASDSAADTALAPADSQEPQPQLHVSPESMDFGQLAVGDSLMDVVILGNYGDAELRFSSFGLSDLTGAFSIGEPSWDPALQPGDFYLLEISFAPPEPLSYGENLVIGSDDPTSPAYQLPLAGEGLAGALEADSGSLDLGTVSIGCQSEELLEILNSGNDALLLEEVTLSSDEAGFSFSLADELPLALEPSVSQDLLVGFAPLHSGAAAETLSLLTDDGDELQVALSGEGESLGEVTDSFTVGAMADLDILFAVDKSGSMADDNAQIVSAIGSLTGVLDDSGARYQLAAVVQDDGCIVGSQPWIDESFDSAAAVVAMDEMVNEGSAGNNSERAFMLMEAALNQASAGGCNEGLLRESAWLHLVGVSDEPEQSVQSYSYYMASFQGMVADPSMVVFHAIGGDYPGGCGSGVAAPYAGMYEAVVNSGGYFISICTGDMAGELEVLGEQMVALSGGDGTYPLSQAPVEASLLVLADGKTVGDWSYDAEENAIRFDKGCEPAEGAIVEVSYHLAGDCG